MARKASRFAGDESGAITVDWVVLTAAILGVLFGALNVFNTGVSRHADLTSQTLESRDIPTY